MANPVSRCYLDRGSGSASGIPSVRGTGSRQTWSRRSAWSLHALQGRPEREFWDSGDPLDRIQVGLPLDAAVGSESLCQANLRPLRPTIRAGRRPRPASAGSWPEWSRKSASESDRLANANPGPPPGRTSRPPLELQGRVAAGRLTRRATPPISCRHQLLRPWKRAWRRRRASDEQLAPRPLALGRSTGSGWQFCLQLATPRPPVRAPDVVGGPVRSSEQSADVLRGHAWPWQRPGPVRGRLSASSRPVRGSMPSRLPTRCPGGRRDL